MDNPTNAKKVVGVRVTLVLRNLADEKIEEQTILDKPVTDQDELTYSHSIGHDSYQDGDKTDFVRNGKDQFTLTLKLKEKK